MIQNNWHVTVSGFVETQSYDDRHVVRLWFMSFNMIVAVLMINVLVGVLIDTLDLYRRDEVSKYQQSLEERKLEKEKRALRDQVMMSPRHLTRNKQSCCRRFQAESEQPQTHGTLGARRPSQIGWVLGEVLGEDMAEDNKLDKPIPLSGDATVLKKIADWMQDQLSRKNTPSSLSWCATWEVFGKSKAVDQLIVDNKMMQDEAESRSELTQQQQLEQRHQTELDEYRAIKGELEEYRALKAELEEYRLLKAEFEEFRRQRAHSSHNDVDEPLHEPLSHSPHNDVDEPLERVEKKISYL